MSKHFRENFLSAACGGWWIFCPRRGYRASVTRNPSLSQTRSTSVRYVMARYVSSDKSLKRMKRNWREFRNAPLSILRYVPRWYRILSYRFIKFMAIFSKAFLRYINRKVLPYNVLKKSRS